MSKAIKNTFATIAAIWWPATFWTVFVLSLGTGISTATQVAMGVTAAVMSAAAWFFVVPMIRD